MHDLRVRRDGEEVVHRAALVGFDVGERDPTQIGDGDDPIDRLGHEREQPAHAGVEQERLVAADQELVEGEPRGGAMSSMGGQAEDVGSDLFDLGEHRCLL